MQNKVLEHKKIVIQNLKNYFYKSDIKNAVIGISGGIDSAVALAILSEILEAKNIFAYFIDIESNPKDYEDAKELVNNLNIQLNYTNLSISFNSLKNDFKQDNKMALGNIKSRLRAIYLYDQAYNHSALVCGTSNLDELYIGYFTKFGDSANDVPILNGFIKSDIYELAKHYKLPLSIINKAPSAGLWENQTDEQEIGLKYKEIDDYLSCNFVNEDVIEKITNLHNKNLHKLSYNYDMNKSNEYMELINGKSNKK